MSIYLEHGMTSKPDKKFSTLRFSNSKFACSLQVFQKCCFYLQLRSSILVKVTRQPQMVLNIFLRILCIVELLTYSPEVK